MNDDELVGYLREHYGRCKLNANGEACACLQGRRWPTMLECPDWLPTAASTWQELYFVAKQH